MHLNFCFFQDFAKISKLCTIKTVPVSKLGWQSIDLTSTVKDWYKQSNNEKLKLLIDCSGCRDIIDVHLFNTDGILIEKPYHSNYYHQNQHHHKYKTNLNIDEPNRPFLVVNIEPNIMKRVRRRALDCSGAIKSQCCKEPFYVSFKALGWDDWIIAPHGYFANYCRGDCGGYRTPDTFLTYYTHVIEEYRKNDKLNGMQPCCAPLKFSSMSLIYFGPDSTIIKRDLPKMVVDECGCP